MELFKMFYDLSILACVLAILAGSQILAIYLQYWIDRPKRQHLKR
jgi:hypothetical protein